MRGLEDAPFRTDLRWTWFGRLATARRKVEGHVSCCVVGTGEETRTANVSLELFSDDIGEGVVCKGGGQGKGS